MRRHFRPYRPVLPNLPGRLCSRNVRFHTPRSWHMLSRSVAWSCCLSTRSRDRRCSYSFRSRNPDQTNMNAHSLSRQHRPLSTNSSGRRCPHNDCFRSRCSRNRLRQPPRLQTRNPRKRSALPSISFQKQVLIRIS